MNNETKRAYEGYTNVERLRASHDRLLKAAMATLPLVVAKDFTPGRQYVTRLRAAIAAAEKLV